MNTNGQAPTIEALEQERQRLSDRIKTLNHAVKVQRQWSSMPDGSVYRVRNAKRCTRVKTSRDTLGLIGTGEICLRPFDPATHPEIEEFQTA